MTDLGSKVASISIALGLILTPIKTLAEDTKRYVFGNHPLNWNNPINYPIQTTRQIDFSDYNLGLSNDVNEYSGKRLALEFGDFKVKFDGKMLSLLFTKRF